MVRGLNCVQLFTELGPLLLELRGGFPHGITFSYCLPPDTSEHTPP